MSKMVFPKLGCAWIAPLPFCCRTPQAPWPEDRQMGLPVAPMQWRLHRNGTGRMLFVQRIAGEEDGLPGWCVVDIFDPEGRQTMGNLPAIKIGHLYPVVVAGLLTGAPEIPTVREGEHRRDADGIEVIVGLRDVVGEYPLLPMQEPEEPPRPRLALTYSPREILRLYPYVVPEVPLKVFEELLDRDPRAKALVRSKSAPRLFHAALASVAMGGRMGRAPR